MDEGASGSPFLPVSVEDAEHLEQRNTHYPALPISVMAAESAKHFHQTTVWKAIYATGWDGTVRVVVKGKDDFTVFRER